MKQIDEATLWRQVSKAIHKLPYTVEIPLSFIEQTLWPTADSNELKSIRERVCAFCNEYRINDLGAFVKHLKSCNPSAYKRLMRILGEGHEHER